MKTTRVHGEPSWRIASETVEAFVTKRGGHLAPVTFDRKGAAIQPYAIAPWIGEKLPSDLPPILQVLRGDFFCMPFGGNTTPFKGERHQIHGQTANEPWNFESLTDGRLHLSMATTTRAGRVDKTISVRDGHNAVYCKHVISGMTGPMDLGHHATLKFPDTPNSGLISTSPFVFGQVFPGTVERPEERGYSALKEGARFESLSHVAMANGEIADLSRYPARRGFEDVAMIVAEPSASLAWTAVSFPKQRYVWFALKDPGVLRNTVFWMSNGGRHYPPWSGRHISVMGLEEVTANFALGLAESARKNSLTELGYPTTLKLSARRPTVINYIMAVAGVPAGFDRVRSITPGGDGVILTSESGLSVSQALAPEFIHSGP